MRMRTLKEKLMLTKINKNIERMNKSDLEFLKNHGQRIIKREKEIEHLDSLFKPAPTPIKSNEIIKISFKHKPNRIKDTFYKKSNNNLNNLNLPRLNTEPNTLDTYKRMKKYKVILKKKKELLSEEKIKNFLGQSGFDYMPSRIKFGQEEKFFFNENEKNNNQNSDEKEKNDTSRNSPKDKISKNEKIKENNSKKKKNSPFKKRNSNFIEDKASINRLKNNLDDRDFQNRSKSKKMDFEYYLKMQSKAEIKLKPKIGDDSNDLVYYIRAIQGIRENLITDILEEINKAENRYNKEKPEDDANLIVREKSLNVHKWKNIFYLRDYQKFFLEGLKGKISNKNYEQMERKFRQIQHVCFSEGKKHFNDVKNLKFSE